ncbi:M23 family metallopeptidase [Caminicella sporogenes]|uniref:M23 family metallopeptidase n=1 Tax=Caminicella sporogenes TaxID=166485 RepID=UPI002540912C|nr:M23 family metallopeptidase [Caminicella sporogenes]WIF94852.1 M23 family metallopeptidase [Caminicella sporogenes]
MNYIRKIIELFSQNFTFVIIPHDSKKMKQISLNKGFTLLVVIIFLFSSIFSISSSFYLYTQNIYLHKNIKIKDDTIKNLNTINKEQQAELDKLKNTSKIVFDKLSQLHALENKVRNMLGLKNSKENDKIKATSRSFNRTILLNKDLTNKESINTIASIIDTEKNNYDKLIKDIDKQLKYLNCKPNLWPVKGKITSKFGYRIHPFSKRRDFHKGLDIANKEGTNILAAGSGIVTYSGYNGSYGNVIVISHGYGYKSVYAHNKINLVKVGEKVKKGQVIAKLGNTGRSTGPHLHFEIHYNGIQIDPLKILNHNN